MSFFLGTTRLETGGDWQGWYDLNASNTSRTINIPADAVFDGFAIENKNEGAVTIKIEAVAFKMAGVNLTDFDNNRTFGYNSQHKEGNTWTIGWDPEAEAVANYGRAGFDIGTIVTGEMYESVTFTYASDKQVRVGFFNDGDRLETFVGGWQGWIDLELSATSKTINIPADAIFNKFAVENKGEGTAEFTFVSVIFNKAED